MCIACRPGVIAFARGGMLRGDFAGRTRRLAAGAEAGSALFGGSGQLARAYAANHDPGHPPAAAGGGGGGWGLAAGQTADKVFENGPIYTMDPANSTPEAIAVSLGRIIAVGTRAEIDALKGPKTKVVDLAGRTLLPGFIDPHMHFVFAFFDDWLDLGPFANKTLEDVRAKLAATVAAAKPGDWVLAQMFDPLITPGVFDASIQALDAIAPRNPVFILEDNGHVAFANSAAFALAGVSSSTPDPDHGRFVRDAAGHLTGEIQEGPAIGFFSKVAPAISPEQYIANIGKLFETAAAAGCTSVHDCGIGLIDPHLDWGAINAAMKNTPPVRFAGYLVSTAMEQWTALGLKPGAVNSDTFRVSGIKAWVDGSNQAGTGYQREPYLVKEWGVGVANYTPASLLAAVEAANDLGWQVGVHANGDAGIDLVLDAYEAALQKTPNPDARHRIEHCSILHPEQMERMARLGVSPSFLIGHVYFWGNAFQTKLFGPERANLLDPCATAAAKGLRFSLHSDYNVTPIEPLRYVHNAVTRTMLQTGQPLNPAEAVTPMQALKAVTIDAAWQCHLDDITGSLERGKYADLVILDRDPLSVDPASIKEIKVQETWLGGEKRYNA